MYTRMGPLVAVWRVRMGYDQRYEVGLRLLFSVTELGECYVSCARWCRLPVTTELAIQSGASALRMCRVCVSRGSVCVPWPVRFWRMCGLNRDFKGRAPWRAGLRASRPRIPRALQAPGRGPVPGPKVGSPTRSILHWQCASSSSCALWHSTGAISGGTSDVRSRVTSGRG